MKKSSEARAELFLEVVNLKKLQKNEFKSIRQLMRNLERQNLSTTGFTKLTTKSIKMIQTQRRANAILLKTHAVRAEKISKKLTKTETNYLKLVSKKQKPKK